MGQYPSAHRHQIFKKNSSDFKVLNEKQTFSAEPNQNTLEGLCFKTKYMYTKHQITEYPCHIIISCHISDKVSHALNVNTFSESYFFFFIATNTTISTKI